MEANAGRADSEYNIIVYVAPTNALMTQIAADIYLKYKGPIFGIWNAEVTHNVDKCQVLITSPAILDKILLSPNWASFVSRIRYAILDEIHFLALQDSESWARLFMLLPCPFVALSATLGNKELLVSWLNTVRESRPTISIDVPQESALPKEEVPAVITPSAKGAKPGKVEKPGKGVAPAGGWQKTRGDKGKAPLHGAMKEEKERQEQSKEASKQLLPVEEKKQPVELIVHSERWSPLNRLIYVPGSSSFLRFHPAYALKIRDESLTISEEMEFSSRECMDLHKAMCHEEVKAMLPTEEHERLKSLTPDTFFAKKNVILKSDVRHYAVALKRVLNSWSRAQIARVLEILGSQNLVLFLLVLLGRQVENEIGRMEIEAKALGFRDSYATDYLSSHVSDLVRLLHAEKNLPALIFTLHRGFCESLATRLIADLETLEHKTRMEEYDEQAARNRVAEIQQLDSQIAKLMAQIKRLKQQNPVLEQQLAELQDRSSFLQMQENGSSDLRFMYRSPPEKDEISTWQLRMQQKLGFVEG